MNEMTIITTKIATRRQALRGVDYVNGPYGCSQILIFDCHSPKQYYR